MRGIIGEDPNPNILCRLKCTCQDSQIDHEYQRLIIDLNNYYY
jgi:hypothetical protein